MKQEVALEIFEDPPALASGFASWFYDFVSTRPKTNVALSGGSTPKLFFQVLSNEYKDRIDWSGIQLFWGDERCVPPDHQDSNFLMTSKNLFDHISIPSKNVHRILGESDPEKEAQRYGQVLGEVLSHRDSLPVFDLIILGLGSDGHTASIFPDQMHLLQGAGYCEVATHPDSGQRRITLTGKVINQADNICFLVAGAGKSEVVGEILNKTGNWEKYPASYVHGGGDSIHWFLDREAASIFRKEKN